MDTVNVAPWQGEREFSIMELSRSKSVKVSGRLSNDMSSISDIIEEYLLNILKQTPSGTIQVKRSELAELFQCVPSQINYVISTRFTVEKGFIVESKRGGGGFIRIRKVRFSTRKAYFDVLLRMIGNRMTQQAAEDLITRLTDEGLMTEREGRMVGKLIPGMCWICRSPFGTRCGPGSCAMW